MEPFKCSSDRFELFVDIVYTYHSGTDKNESINSSFSASLPKNVNFSRNAQGRVCSVIDRINYGAGNSIQFQRTFSAQNNAIPAIAGVVNMAIIRNVL